MRLVSLLISQSLKKALAAAFSSHLALTGGSHGDGGGFAGLQETPIMAPLSARRSSARSWKGGRTERERERSDLTERTLSCVKG